MPTSQDIAGRDLPLSKNSPTIDHLKIACRHVDELKTAGVTENLAIRTLELFADTYAKLRLIGQPGPLHARHVDLWSDAARRIKADNPEAQGGTHFRVEHGTPRRAFAKMVIKLYKEHALTAAAMNELCERHWAVAVITLAEDRELNRIARSEASDTPEERWRAAGITFTGSGRISS